MRTLGLILLALALPQDSTKIDTLRISVRSELQNIEAAQKNIEDQYKALENIKAYLKAKQAAADTAKKK
jgi:hypothetical protein